MLISTPGSPCLWTFNYMPRTMQLSRQDSCSYVAVLISLKGWRIFFATQLVQSTLYSLVFITSPHLAAVWGYNHPEIECALFRLRDVHRLICDTLYVLCVCPGKTCCDVVFVQVRALSSNTSIHALGMCGCALLEIMMLSLKDEMCRNHRCFCRG